MASLNNIEVKQEIRPCYIKDIEDRKALFHKWVHTKNLLGQEFEVGIVEYENGQIDEVAPRDIRFCDNKVKEYSFETE